MSKKKKAIQQPLKREDVYNGTVYCPICREKGILREVSTFRVGTFIQSKPKHKDYMGMCPICRR